MTVWKARVDDGKFVPVEVQPDGRRHMTYDEFLRGFGSDLVKVESAMDLPVGRFTITFLHTPGHTPGSQCFLVDGRIRPRGDLDQVEALRVGVLACLVG